MSTIYNLKVFHSLTIDRWASINYTLNMKRFKFPKGCQLVHFPINGARFRIGNKRKNGGTLCGFPVYIDDGTMSSPNFEEIKEDIKQAREKMGYSKSSWAEYILKVNEWGGIETEIIFNKK